MPRWLIASFIAFMLACYGFTAAAQVWAGDLRDGASELVSAQDPAAADDPSTPDADDETAGLDEAGPDLAEFLVGGHPLLLAASAAAWPPRPAPTSSPSPCLERPKRPPRGNAFPV
jgi:hypothetical protein